MYLYYMGLYILLLSVQFGIIHFWVLIVFVHCEKTLVIRDNSSAATLYYIRKDLIAYLFSDFITRLKMDHLRM